MIWKGLSAGPDYDTAKKWPPARAKLGLEAPSGVEPLHRSFADCSLNHLGTAPRAHYSGPSSDISTYTLAGCRNSPPAPQTVAREARDGRERRDPKFEVPGSKFRKPRTSDFEPSPFPSVVPDVRTSEVL